MKSEENTGIWNFRMGIQYTHKILILLHTPNPQAVVYTKEALSPA